MIPNERLNFFLREKRIKQIDLSKKLRINRPLVNNYVKGRNRITERVAFLLKEHYRLNPDWLLHGTEPMYLNPSKSNYQDPAQSDLNQAYESLSEEAKKRLLELAKKEQEKELRRAEAMPERKSDPANDTGLILNAIGGIKDEIKKTNEKVDKNNQEIHKTNQEIHKTNKDVESLKKKMEELSSDQKPTQRSKRSDQVNAKNVGLP